MFSAMNGSSSSFRTELCPEPYLGHIEEQGASVQRYRKMFSAIDGSSSIFSTELWPEPYIGHVQKSKGLQHRGMETLRAM